YLEKIVALKRRYVTFFPPAEHPYDVLLDDFEPSMKTAEVKAIFAQLRPRQVELIRAVAAAYPVDDSFLRASYAEPAMLEFAGEVVTWLGFDWTRGRQDKSLHPFATAIGAGDVRITTRWVEGMPLGLLFGTMHETAEPPWGNPGGPLPPLLGALLSAPQRAVSSTTRRRNPRAVLPRYQQGPAVADPCRGTRGDLQPARDAPGGARDWAH